MELLTNTVPTVRLDFPDPGTTGITATYSINGASAVPLTPISVSTGYATANLPYQQNDAQIVVTWSFTIPGGSYTQVQYYDVVTPLLTETQVRDILSPNTPTDQEVFDIEASARYIISAYTGQTFGKYVGPISVTGNGDSTLRLPRRLMVLNTINDITANDGYVSIRGGGWFLTSNVIGAPTVRADWDGWHQVPDSGVITAPPRWVRPYLTFGYNLEYVVDGEWGWNYVPAAVVEAAKLLVNDYACNDSIYRDRFITAVSGPDWQIRFNEGAFTSTGNVRADQLLGEFKLRRGWMVI